MKKLGILCCACMFCLQLCAEIISGVAIRVNSHAITLQEIKQMQANMKVSRNEAIELLINECLKKDEIERFKISVDEFKIDDEIAQIAENSGMTKSALIAKVAKKGMNYQEYRNEIKKQIQTRELVGKILMSHINIIDEDELMRVYQRNKKDYELPKVLKVVRYSATTDALLQRAIKAPKAKIENVDKFEETIEVASLNPQVMQIFLNTPIGSFTPILTASKNMLVAFQVIGKEGLRLLSFEEARPMIGAKLAAEKEKSVLADHFARLRKNANIVVVRE